MNYLSLSGIIIAVGSLLCALLVILSRPTNVLKLTWGFFSFTVALWGFGLFKAYSSLQYEDALFWLRFLNLSAIFIPTFFVHFVFIFSKLKDQNEPRLYYALTGIIIAVAAFRPELFIPTISSKGGFAFYPDPGVAYYFFFIFFVFLAYRGLYILFQFFRRSTGLFAVQSKYILLGTSFGYLGGGTTFFYVFNIPVYPFGVCLVVLYVFSVTYAITRFRLMDIRVVVSSAVIFFGVYSLALGIPFLLFLKEQYFASLLTSIALVTPAQFFYNRLIRRAEDKILSAERADQEVLLSASKGLSKHKTEEEIVKFIGFIFNRIFKVKRLAFYICNGDILTLHSASLNSDCFPPVIQGTHPLVGFFRIFAMPQDIHEFKEKRSFFTTPDILELLSKLPAQLAIPIVRSEKLIGLIFLGEREGELLYSTRDMEVIGVISDQIALAIENAGYLEVTKKDFFEVMHDRRLKDIGILGSTISHQLGNRLHRITLGTGYFKQSFCEKALANDTREELVVKLEEALIDMNRMEECALNAIGMADALKAFSKSGADPEVISFRRLVKIAKDLVDAKHPNFTYNLLLEPVDDFNLYVNEPSIQDVFLNAFDNGIDAIKIKIENTANQVANFTPQIVVRAKKQGQMLLIEIEDNGIGFKPEFKDKFFIPFFTTKGSDKGTGLGLHAMRELVRRNGGAIDISSEYLQWARVSITLPLAAEIKKEGQ